MRIQCEDCGKKVPRRYNVGHARFHRVLERKEAFLKTCGKKFRHLWRIIKRARRTSENLRLARARQKQTRLKRRIIGGILPPKPIIIEVLENPVGRTNSSYEKALYASLGRLSEQDRKRRRVIYIGEGIIDNGVGSYAIVD